MLKKTGLFIRSLRKDFDLYLIILPGIAILLTFKYVPMYGATIAFKDYSLLEGISGSPWVGLKHFAGLFASPKFLSVFANTIIINAYRIVFYFPLPIMLAILINEVKSIRFKRIAQTITYLPYFLSWVVISAIFIDILSPQTGIINRVIQFLGGKPVMFMTDQRFFRGIIVASNAWQRTGWTAIIYLAAMQGIDPQLYDAARVDGARKIHEIFHITLPGISPAILFMFMLHLGYFLRTDVEQILMLYNPIVYSVGDVLGTYIYRIGLGQMKYSMTTAVGLFQAVIGFNLLFLANFVSRKFGQQGLW